MTVSYALAVSSVSYVAFLKLLKKWKGSILKAVWAELVVWLVLYAIISLIFNLCFSLETVRILSSELDRLNRQLDYLDLKFMLGFFVTQVIDRWKTVLHNIGFIETVALSVSTIIRGKDDNARLARRSIIRYLVLSQILVLRDISMRVRRRFPTLKSLVESGFLFENEIRELETTEIDFNKYWMPINWANSIVWRMQEQKYIEAPVSTNNVLNNIRDFRMQLENLCKFDWVPLPIAYPQIVFLAVRIYYILALFTRQYIPVDEVGMWYRYIPLMPAMSFLFYVGWMKVAEAMLNPLGEDDDDFEGNWVIDKNITTGMQIVDQSHGACPDLNIDQFLDPKFGPMYPNVLHVPTNRLHGSASDVVIPEMEHSKMVHTDSQNSVHSGASGQHQQTMRQRFRRMSSKLKLGRSPSGQRQSIKSPGAESTQSAFANLEFVTECEENEEKSDPRADLRIDLEIGGDELKK